jgi:hypothetical protein
VAAVAQVVHLVSTQLYFKSTAPDWSRGEGDTDILGTSRNWTQLLLSTGFGAGAATQTRTSVTGPTAGIEAGTNVEWVTEPIDQDVTISGTIEVRWTGLESSMNANATIGVIIERLNSQGARVSTIASGIAGSELGTISASNNFNPTVTSTNMLKGDRIRVRSYFSDATATTMASGFVLTWGYAGTSSAAADSYVLFTETFGFLTTAPSGSILYLTDSASAVDPNGASYDAKEAWTSRGAGVVSVSTDSVAGPSTPLLARITGADNFIEWFTKGLTAFTLSGLVACNIRANQSSFTPHLSVRCEIAVCATGGTSPVVWGAANDGVELPSSTETAMTFNVAGDDTAVTDGQRLRIRIYFDDARGTAMLSTTDAGVLYYAGTSAAASGDTYITLPQTVTEFSSAATSLIYDTGLNMALMGR